MIKLNETYSTEKDTYGWQLHEARQGKDKDGAPKMQRKTTYHGTAEQALNYVIDRKCGDCSTAEELRDLLKNAQRECLSALSGPPDNDKQEKKQ